MRLIIFITILLWSKFSFASNNLEVLSTSSIFKPLIADPKYPKFTLAYNYYTKGSYNKHVFSPNFGAVLPIAVYQTQNGIKYEFAIHGGVFSTMDIGSSPTRLINADYFGGGAVAINHNNWDHLIRIAHTSSHLGDELLLSKEGRQLKRINLSYETAEIITAYNFANGFRPYFGLGYIVHAEPNSYRSAEFTFGADYRYPHQYLDDYATPIFGIYTKTSKNYAWNPNLSVKFGFEFKRKYAFGKRMQLLFEYYNGNSIHGQFYKKREHYFGPSLNINF